MIAIEVQHHLDRARDFLKGMDLLQIDLAEYRYSSALLGIHGAISYCDALRVGLGSTKVSSDNHRSAAKELKLLLATRKFENPQGVGRLEELLSKKSRIAYAADTARENEIKQVVLDAKRFEAWAEAAGKELRIEGWRDD
jgi:hypothetical protein